MFLGANGVHEQLGFTTPDPEEALLKQMALTLANEGYFLIDESKFFGSCVLRKLPMWKEANIITNHLEIDLEKYKRQTNVIEADKQ